RLTKRRRFLLDTTRIGEDQVSPIHHLDEGEVAQRFEQVDPGTAGEALEHRTPDLRVQMDRIDDRHVRVPLGDQAESVANRLERRTKALTAVGRYENQSLAVAVRDTLRERIVDRATLPDSVEGDQEGIDPRVARHQDALAVDALSEQVLPADRRGRV